MPIEIKPVSYWSFSMYHQCPHKYELVILDKTKLPDFILHDRTVLGALVHSTMEFGFSKDLWLNWDHAFAKAEGLLAVKTDQGVLRRQIKRAKKSVEWCKKILARFISPEYKFHPEFKYKVPHDLPGVNDFKLAGRVDLIVEGPTGCWIFDYKGNSKLQSMKKEQLWFYSRCVEAIFKKPLVEACFLWYTEGIVQPYRLDEVGAVVQGVLNELKDSVQTGNFPAKISRECTWCDVKGKCKAYQELINGPSQPNPVAGPTQSTSVAGGPGVGSSEPVPGGAASPQSNAGDAGASPGSGAG